MKFYKPYDGTQEVYRIAYESFNKPLTYLSPGYERILRAKYFKRPYYRPEVKRLNTPDVSGYAPKIANR